MSVSQRSEAESAETMKGVNEVKEEGEFDPDETQPTKIHVRGVERLNTDQIEKWVGEHVGADLFRKVQWIDDSSANLIFDTEVAASDALNMLSVVEGSGPLELRKAKELSTHPDHDLQVRMAIVTDVKTKGAKDRSAFYLFNPEWDPDNPNNVRHDSRKRRWADDGGRERNKYRRREWEDDRHHRRESRDQGNFTEDMYDEGTGTASAPPENRRASSGSEYSRRKITFDDDPFAPKQNGRLRDRSASPGRAGDGRYGFSEDQPRRRTARPRSATPPGIRKNRDNRNAREATRKELFPDKPSVSAFSNGYGHLSDRPSTPTSNSGPRELFPDRQGTPNHRRQDGRDLPLDEVVHFMGRHSLDGTYENDEHRTYQSHYSGARPSSSRSNQTDRGDRGKGRDLFARIDGVSDARASGRLSRDGDDDVGISIKGNAMKSGGGGNGDQGFSFLGASKEGQKTENPLVKELFPLKNGPAKDLFDGRIKGRASGRRRAEDLF